MKIIVKKKKQKRFLKSPSHSLLVKYMFLIYFQKATRKALEII